MLDARTSAIAQLPYIINGTLELEEVLHRALEQVQRLTGSERSTIVLRGSDEQLCCHAALAMDQTEWETKRYDFARCLVKQVVAEGRAQLTSDAQVDQRPDLARSMGIRSILCVPLVSSNRSVGAIYAERRLTQSVFTPDDLDLLEHIALHTSVAIENARRYGSALEQGRQEGAASMAEAMVLTLLPQEAPRVPGFDVAARWQSAGQISADFYDIFPLAERDRWGLVVADVSDRGPPAAIFMALTRSIIRGSVTAADGPAAGIRQANRLIYADAHPDRYVVAFYGELDVEGGLHYVNAGLPAPLWWQAERASVTTLASNDASLGRNQDLPVVEYQAALGTDDVLLFWSDGLTEAQNPKGRPFGEARLAEILQKNAQYSASLIAAAILEEVQLWLRGQPPHDDLLLVVVKYRQEMAG